MKTVVELLEMRANITGEEPEQLLSEFIAKHGPDWEDRVLEAQTIVLKSHNEFVMGLKKRVADMTAEVDRLNEKTRKSILGKFE